MFIQYTREEYLSYSHFKENLEDNCLVLNEEWVSLTAFIQCVSLANMIIIMCQDTMDA